MSTAKKTRAMYKRRTKALTSINNLVNTMNVSKFKKLSEYQKILRRIQTAGTRDIWHWRQLLDNMKKKMYNK